MDLSQGCHFRGYSGLLWGDPAHVPGTKYLSEPFCARVSWCVDSDGGSGEASVAPAPAV